MCRIFMAFSALRNTKLVLPTVNGFSCIAVFGPALRQRRQRAVEHIGGMAAIDHGEQADEMARAIRSIRRSQPATSSPPAP
jgi:hypothetical protein